MNDMHETFLAACVLGAVSICVGLMLTWAQARTRTALGLGLAYVFVGMAIPLAFHLAGEVDSGTDLFLARVQGVAEVIAVVGCVLYIEGLAATSNAGPGPRRRVERALRILYGLSIALLLAGLVAPATRLNDFEMRVLDPDAYGQPGFWVFATLWLCMTPLFMYCYRVLAAERLDVGEDGRAVCSFIASPMLASVVFLPRTAALVAGTASMVIVLFGQFRFAVAQGERGAFLSRFLSPRVAEQVRTDGLTSVMEPADLDLTVVACDLRGFTAYAEGVPSQAVIDLLGEYYAAVGRAVAEVDGTIKDYAGDGILVLVGAPIARDDHAAAGLRLARVIHEVTRPVIARWSTGPHPLGLGVGAASGRVTVGAIGSDARMEYTAVGVPVNLAARLCASAAAGETLVDQRLAAASGAEGLIEREPVQLKGFGTEVPVFATP